MNIKNYETRKLVILGMMVAVTIVLGYTPIGFIMIPPISLTTVHIPTIITGILIGPIEGIIVGASMGVVSLLRALTSPIVFDKLFVDPRISILPRIFIGLVAYLVFILIKRLLTKILSNNSKVDAISIFVGAVFGSLTNTAGVLGMLYLLYAQKIINEAGTTIKNLVFGAISINIIVEMLVVAFVSTPIVLALKKVVKTKL